MSLATEAHAEPRIAVACAAPNATWRRLSHGTRRYQHCLQSGEAQTVEEAPPVATVEGTISRGACRGDAGSGREFPVVKLRACRRDVERIDGC